MIRRGFWLMTGAVLGVAGYRKATRLGRMLSGQQPAPATRPLGAGTRSLAAGTRSAAGFVRDVRAGMAEYHEDLSGRAQPGNSPLGPREP